MCDTNEFAVQGMTCSACATKVSTAVSRVPGVVDTDVDLAAGTIQVIGAAVDGGAVHAAITDAGHQVG